MWESDWEFLGLEIPGNSWEFPFPLGAFAPAEAFLGIPGNGNSREFPGIPTPGLAFPWESAAIPVHKTIATREDGSFLVRRGNNTHVRKPTRQMAVAHSASVPSIRGCSESETWVYSHTVTLLGPII